MSTLTSKQLDPKEPPQLEATRAAQMTPPSAWCALKSTSSP